MAIEFNNMSLPDIPVDVIKTHPYIIIFYNIEKNLTIMYTSTKEFVYIQGHLINSSIPYLTKSFGEVVRYNHISETNVWEKSPIIPGGEFVFDDTDCILWANHNIYYIDDYNSETGEYTKTPQIYIDAHLPKPPENIIAEFPYYYIKKSNVNEMEVWFLVATKSPAIYIPSRFTDNGYNKMISESIGYRVMAFSATTIQSYAVLGWLEGGTHSWQRNTVVDDKIYIDNYFQTGRDIILTSNYDIYIATSYDGDSTVTIGSELYFVNPYKKITSDSHYKAIASKVREILDNDTTYKPRELPDAIRSISDILNPYDVQTGLVYRKDGAKVAGSILYPGLYTLDNCTEVVLPDNITEIAPYGLQYLSFYINKLICNEGLTKIGNYAATLTLMLKEVKFPKSLISIGDGAFYGAGLTSLELPDNLESIGYLTFGSCKMSSLTIPKSVKRINMAAFLACKELTEVNVLSDQLTEFYPCFDNCTSLKRVDFKGNISKLYSSNWFSGCTALEALIIRGSFCSLTSTKPFDKSTISSGTGYIYVPSALLDKYKTATYWSTYASQIRAIEDYPEICDPTE